MSQDLDQKIQDVYRHIQTERKILEASQLLRQATNNQDVVKKTDVKIRETERTLSYFENTLRELQALKLQGQDPARPGGSISPQVPSKDNDGRAPHSPELGRQQQPPPSRIRLSNLDLIKADTPITPAKISRMLHQLEFKLQIEMQYKEGIDKMARLYQADGDKKSRADAGAKRVESDRKIQLLQTALKRYKNLHVIDAVADEDENDNGDAGERRDNLRKPLSGTLKVTLKGARELDHAPVTGRRSTSRQIVETFVSIKVEGNQLARSHPSRTDRWNEDFEITVEKANEVEIVLYDRIGNDPNPIPIGLLWIRINDLVDALRRRKVGMETGNGAWVTAGAMPGDSPTTMMSGSQMGDGQLGYGGPVVAPMGQSGWQPAPAEGIDAWFAIEPAGAIALHLNFIKENVRKRPLDAPLGGLGRQGAVRIRKGEVHEQNGHKFVQRQFYQLMLCAFCNDFLLNAAGYQCEDCRYTCHKKCYEKVVTKCISRSNTGEGDEEKINHRIPHRFEPITNFGANWCCHCGYMLPFGRKNARKCSECDITCHANCAHLVPDFCGMSMETANELLRNWRDIKSAQTNKARRQQQQQQAVEQAQATSPSVDMLSPAVDRVRITPVQDATPVISEPYTRPPQGAPLDRYPQDPRYYQTPAQQQPLVQPPTPRLPAGTKVIIPPGYPQTNAYDQVPPLGPDGYSQTAYPQGPRPGQQSPGPKHTPLPPMTSQRPERPAAVPPSIPHVQRVSVPQQQAVVRQPSRRRKVGLDDFNFLAVLGKGNFGKVMLAEEKKTNGLYAIKVLKKEFIIENDEVESTRSEKRVFLTAAKERHPFLLGLHSCFQTETRIYFVMEYVSGGDLMLHIQRKQFSLRQAKFYASEVLLALEYFHQNGIIYRDLKLDNILLTLDGHVKVADYGLCKEDMWYGNTTSTFCGTPEFMAPEILLEQRYGRAVDWWAFGVLMYEMLLGQSPFRGDDEDEIFDAILEDEPLYPITMPRDAVSILQKLLTKDPNRRLGSGKEDAEEIKRQPFFKDVNWDDVFHKRIPPPYFPTINGSADTSNFDEEFTKEQPTLTPVQTQLSSRKQAEFNGFSWVATWADI
ncbi:hypothetical protein AX15_000099 [Amanita polypyramis BW_CC]|nr:hypothetical protein AX15_000099 [Amanita polypyramis BW_CC]